MQSACEALAKQEHWKHGALTASWFQSLQPILEDFDGCIVLTLSLCSLQRVPPALHGIR